MKISNKTDIKFYFLLLSFEITKKKTTVLVNISFLGNKKRL